MPANSLAPLTLSWVCRYWRRLCIATPRIWADIVLGYHEHLVARELPLLDLFLSRTGTHPISFKHAPDLTDHLHVLLDERDIELYRLGMNEILERVRSRSEQLRVVVLNAFDIAAVNPVLSMIQRARSIDSPSCPLLDELRVAVIHVGQPSECFVLQNLDIACPSLKIVSLFTPMVAPSSYTSAMQNLRHLDLNYCTSINYCMQWLDSTPALESLKLRLFCRSLEVETEDVDDDGWTIVSVRRHPSLRRLSRRPVRRLERLSRLDVTCYSSATDVGIVLDMLDLPSLKELMLYTPVISDGDWPYVRDLISRSEPPLEHLKLAGTPMKALDIVRCLRSLPGLKKLSIQRLKDADALFSALTINAFGGDSDSKNLLSNSPLCPWLEVLDVADASQSIDSLARLIVSRCTIAEEKNCRGGSETLTRLKKIELDAHIGSRLKSDPSIEDCISRGLSLTIT